jgi:cyanophycin synthetase
MKELVVPLGAWQHRQGLCYGLQQSVLSGSIRVRSCTEPEVARLEEALGVMLDEPLPAAGAGVAIPWRIAQLLAFAHGAIQRQSRIAVSHRFALVTRADDASVVELRMPCPDPEPGQIAMRWALAFLSQATAGAAAFDAERAREAIHAQLHPHANPGLNTFNVLQAAHRLGVPVQRLTRRIVVLGCGARSRWMESTMTDGTPMIGGLLARAKHLTASVLRAAGLPGGVNRLVGSAAEAVEAAAALGYPVVVKPADQDRGTGVHADLRDPASVASAYDLAREHSAHILVERWAAGATHRLTVFHGQVIRVTRRVAAGVTGDGRQTVRQLVAQYQQSDSQQRALRRLGKVLVALDEEALGLLHQQQIGPDEVPAPGRRVRLRRRDNINAGGVNESVPLEGVHADNLQVAVDAAAALRLDIAGVDLIAEDIGRSWLEAPALICEVNGGPQLGARSEPQLYDAIVRGLLQGNGRIPVTLAVRAAAGREGAAADAARDGDAGLGVSSQAGLWVGGRRVTVGFEDGFAAASALLRRTDVHRAVCVMAPSEVLRTGLPLDAFDVVSWDGDAAWSTEEQRMLPAVRALLQGQ